MKPNKDQDQDTIDMHVKRLRIFAIVGIVISLIGLGMLLIPLIQAFAYGTAILAAMFGIITYIGLWRLGKSILLPAICLGIALVTIPISLYYYYQYYEVIQGIAKVSKVKNDFVKYAFAQVTDEAIDNFGKDKQAQDSTSNDNPVKNFLKKEVKKSLLKDNIFNEKREERSASQKATEKTTNPNWTKNTTTKTPNPKPTKRVPRITQSQVTTSPAWASKNPSNIHDYYLALAPKYFSNHICDQADSKAAREAEIRKKNLKHGYLKFSEECVGIFNELVLFRNKKTKEAFFALTKTHASKALQIYILQYNKGEWIDVKADLFPDETAIQQAARRGLNKIDLSRSPEYQYFMDDPKESIPFDFELPEFGYDIQMKLNKELSNDTTSIGRIRWMGERFELVE